MSNCGVVLDVLQGDLDDGLVELLGRDAVEEGQLELARDLGDPGDVLVETLARVFDREVDLVGVVRLTSPLRLTTVIDTGFHSSCATPRTTPNSSHLRDPISAPPAERFHHYISGHRRGGNH